LDTLHNLTLVSYCIKKVIVRSPRVHNHSVGTLSQAETVVISSQQYPFQSAPSQARVRIPSYEMKTDWPPGTHTIASCNPP